MNLIILNGNINSGKSTIGKLLVKKFPDSFHVEADLLHSFFSDIKGEEKWDLTIFLSSYLTRHFLRKGLSVVYSYPLRIKDYKIIIGAVKKLKPEIYSFTLNPSPKVLLSKRADRALTPWEKKRIPVITIDTPDWGLKINNTTQTPNETLMEIINKINKREGKYSFA